MPLFISHYIKAKARRSTSRPSIPLGSSGLNEQTKIFMSTLLATVVTVISLGEQTDTWSCENQQNNAWLNQTNFCCNTTSSSATVATVANSQSCTILTWLRQVICYTETSGKWLFGNGQVLLNHTWQMIGWTPLSITVYHRQISANPINKPCQIFSIYKSLQLRSSISFQWKNAFQFWYKWWQ